VIAGRQRVDGLIEYEARGDDNATAVGVGMPGSESVGDAQGMSNYALEVHYGDGEPTVRIELPGCSADEAEIARESLLQEIEHAVEIEAPLMTWAPENSDQAAGAEINPARATSVDLIDAGQ
jgi:hypothetical protein